MKLETQTFLSSRINVVSVIAGTMITLSSMFFWMSMSAALGYWSYSPEEIPFLGPNFWLTVSVSWVASVFIGGFFTSVASRSFEVRNGVLNALVAWAGSYLLFGGIALTIADSNLRTLLGSPSVGLFWHGFVADASSLLAGVAGGALGAYFEKRHSRKSTVLESPWNAKDFYIGRITSPTTEPRI